MKISELRSCFAEKNVDRYTEQFGEREKPRVGTGVKLKVPEGFIISN